MVDEVVVIVIIVVVVVLVVVVVVDACAWVCVGCRVVELRDTTA